jgi:hypothetical protein
MTFSSVGVVGSGPLAIALSIAIARHGTPVVVIRNAHGELERAETRIDARLRFFVDTGELSDAQASTARRAITLSRISDELSHCDLVIESISGDIRARRALLATLENKLSPGAVLATNSPPESLALLAEVLRRRDQFVGLYFTRGRHSQPPPDAHAKPAARTSPIANPLLELSVLPDTAPGVAFGCQAFAQSVGTIRIAQSQAVAMEYREFLSVSQGA